MFNFQCLHDIFHSFFSQCHAEYQDVFQKWFVMVTHDIIHFGVGDVSAKISQMIKSLSAFGVGRSLIFREKRCNLTADKGSVDHNIFCLSRVDIDAFDPKEALAALKFS